MNYGVMLICYHGGYNQLVYSKSNSEHVSIVCVIVYVTTYVTVCITISIIVYVTVM